MLAQIAGVSFVRFLAQAEVLPLAGFFDGFPFFLGPILAVDMSDNVWGRAIPGFEGFEEFFFVFTAFEPKGVDGGFPGFLDYFGFLILDWRLFQFRRLLA